MNQMFKDPAAQGEFEETGFIKLPWLSAEEVATLIAMYARVTPKTPDGFFFTMAVADTGVKTAVRDGILDVFGPKLNATFIDPLPLLCLFITKTRGDGKAQYTPSHQDWTFVDETRGHGSIHIWCPLEETGDQNGNLCLVPGSNRLRRYPRLAEVSPSAYKPYWHALRQAERAVPTALGEAIFFDSAVVHASSINRTDSLRLVASAIVVPRSATPVLYFQNAADDSLVDEYRAGVDHFLQKPFGARPDALVRSIPKTPVPDVEEELHRFYPDVNLSEEYR